MKKILVFVCLFLFVTNHCWAKHEKGGWILYEYLGSSGNTSTYRITVTVFFSCTQTGPYNINIGIYDAATLSTVNNISFPGPTSSIQVSKTTFSPCMSTPYPTICYLIDTYVTTVSLANNTNGYLIGVTTGGHRIDGIVNIENSQNTGLGITAQIPGTINGVDYHQNTSPVFLFKDTAIICYNNRFEYQFSAIDSVDHDSLSYSFGAGQDGANTPTPPFPDLTYAPGFSGTSPLGSGVTINPVTGLISGTAPATVGEYVVSVYVKEWRHGVLIDSLRKELQVYVNDCSLLGANLQQTYINCDSLSLTFQNLSTASNVSYYTWNFGDSTSPTDTTSTPVPTHTYTRAGTYVLTLTVGNNGGCIDSAKAIVKVYPGFTPRFTVLGSCYQSPFLFTDSTYAKYGTVDSWQWYFGDTSAAGSANNTASTDTASHLYGNPQLATVILNVGSSVGCTGSDTMLVTVNDKPYIFTIPANDTLICSIDTLLLQVQTPASLVSWTNTSSMLNSNTLNPLVIPKDTTIYTVTVKQNGCLGSKSIQVNVLQYIDVKFDPDTMHVCKTDSITLSPISYALNYLWSEPARQNTLSNDSVKYPFAVPTDDSTTYFVAANLGHCQAGAHVTVYASPYPKAKILDPIPDTTICYGDSALLTAIKTGAYGIWSPSNTVSDSASTATFVHPLTTTTYTYTVTDTFYCPKPVSVSVPVNVVPQVIISAGNDTAVVLNQPLQLYTTVTDTPFNYSLTYSWTPTTFLDYSDSANPILTATYAPSPNPGAYVVTAKTQQGCYGRDTIYIMFYTTQPDIFIPTGFSPNNDGKNDVLTPKPVGISKFEYFRVYNRMGQLVFSTSQVGQGWDGTYNGIEQGVGTYVFTAQGIDYNNRVITKKGTVVLIR